MSPLSYACGCLLCAGKSDFFSSFRDAQVVSASWAAAAQPVTTVAFPYTGDYRIDTLIDGPEYRWNAGTPFGTPVVVTFSFMSVKPFYGGTDSGGDVGFTPFTAQQRTAAREIFTRLDQELGLQFVEVADSAGSFGQIRMGNNSQPFSAGYAFLPGTTGGALDGDVWIDNSITSQLVNLAPGSFAYATLAHEIGHALGLKHPGNYNAGETTVAMPGNFLGRAEDNTNFTIMSYRDAIGGQQRDWFGLYDLLALRTFYGAGNAQAGDTVYALGDSAGRRLTTLVDSGGIDTLDFSSSTVGVVVDLLPGAFSSVGRNGSRLATNNLSIDYATVIENVIGTAQGDLVLGNRVANSFTLGAGMNEADGGSGIDTALYVSFASAYQIQKTALGWNVTGQGANDTLINIERLGFAERNIALDANGRTTAKVLGVVFGKESLANFNYAGIGIRLLDEGMDYAGLIAVALKAQLGSTASNANVVNLLYSNIVGVLPSAGDFAYYNGLLTTGQQTQVSLGLLAAETAQNALNINLVGINANGVGYF